MRRFFSYGYFDVITYLCIVHQYVLSSYDNYHFFVVKHFELQARIYRRRRYKQDKIDYVFLCCTHITPIKIMSKLPTAKRIKKSSRCCSVPFRITFFQLTPSDKPSMKIPSVDVERSTGSFSHQIQFQNLTFKFKNLHVYVVSN